MILQRLTELYDRLTDEGESIAPKGWSSKSISFRVIIGHEGKLKAIQDAATLDDERRVLPKMVTPGDVSFTSAITPEYLNGSAEYLLAFDPKGRGKRTAEIWSRFKELHLQARDQIPSTGFASVCRFLETWDPGKLTDEQKTLLTENGGRGVIYLEGEAKPVFTDPAFRSWYDARQGVSSGVDAYTLVGECLITGQTGPLAQTHDPAIKGVIKTAPSGAKIGGSNCPNFDSYGRSGGHNSPVSVGAAFRYSTALNHLLRADSPQKVNVARTTYVFWAARHHPLEETLGGLLADGPTDKERVAIHRLQTYLERVRQLLHGDGPPDDQPFYLLGLHGARARISVRAFLESAVGEVQARVLAFFDETRLAGLDAPLSLRRLLYLSVSDADQIDNAQAAALLEAILTGRRYPESLAVKIIRRWKQDHGEYASFFDPGRAAALKAYLIRNRNIPMTTNLNPNEERVAYRLGRAFAVLERCQRDSNESQGTGAGIRHQFLSAAATTPCRVFPLILRKQTYWARNLSEGRQGYYSQLLCEILGHPSLDHVPARLSLEDQAIFFLGYYHQTRVLWAPRDPENAPPRDAHEPEEADLLESPSA